MKTIYVNDMDREFVKTLLTTMRAYVNLGVIVKKINRIEILTAEQASYIGVGQDDIIKVYYEYKFGKENHNYLREGSHTFSNEEDIDYWGWSEPSSGILRYNDMVEWIRIYDRDKKIKDILE